MRAFFKQILSNLYIYCGNRQIEKMTDEEITTLLNALENVSKLYSYIPEDHQRQIIQKCLIEDKEYQNINARLVSKWFELNGKKFFSEIAHKQVEPPEPVSEEKREMYLKEWQEALGQIGHPEITKPKGSGTKLRESIYAGVPYVSPKEVVEQYKNTNAVKSFWIDGFEIYAKDEADAMRIFIENFGQPKDATINEAPKEGAGQDTGLPESSSNPS